MRKKKESRKPSSELPKEIQDFKDGWVKEVQQDLSSRVKRLKLSPELLFQLISGGVISTELSVAEGKFFDRLTRERPTKVKDEKGKSIHLASGYKEILQKAVDFCLRPLETPSYTWEQLRQGVNGDDDTPLISIPESFLKMADRIIKKTNPKKINEADLNKKQREWISGEGIETIGDVFYVMQYHYLTACLKQHYRKFSLMSNWLKRYHPELYELYLHGKIKGGEHGSFLPSIGKRLKSLDKLVNSEHANPVMVEIAIRQLKDLIESDLLFACVFYTFFYEQRRGRGSDPEKKPLDEVKSYIFYLKFFRIQPIPHKGTSVRSIYDLGVLLLNELARKEIYSTDKYYPFSYDNIAWTFKFRGALLLYKELDDFRKGWAKLR